MKTLHFQFRDQSYQVNKQGQIKANGLQDFSENWIFLGGTKHHWSNQIKFTLEESFEKPEILNGCLGWDLDHGTVRQWGGQYVGGLPRISNAHIVID